LVSESHGEPFVVIKTTIPHSLKLRFKVCCVQKDLRMSAVLEKLIRQWIQAELVSLESTSGLSHERVEEVKGYIPKSLKLQFKVLCVEKQVGMGSVLHSLIQDWVRTDDQARQ